MTAWLKIALTVGNLDVATTADCLEHPEHCVRPS